MANTRPDARPSIPTQGPGNPKGGMVEALWRLGHGEVRRTERPSSQEPKRRGWRPAENPVGQ